ncbi:MAG: metal-dependent phosphohydrolase [Spirochaetales bacterium]|nr:metal-dependent phosphohydrolase [Spirochaetales bacterium]
MNKVTINRIQEDTFLNTKLFLDEKYILLSPEIPFSKELKERLTRWGFTDLLSENGVTAESGGNEQNEAPPLETMVVEKSYEELQMEKETLAYYYDCLEFLNDVFDRFQLDNVLPLNKISDKIKEIKTHTHANRRYILSLPDKAVEGVSYNVCHSIKTTFLALILSEPLRLPIHRQIELGVTAMFHRIGMLRLPPELYMVDRKLRPEERQVLNTYPVLSFRILKAASFPMSIAVGALDHMERIDGTGYPRNLGGDKISLYGKIIGLCSAYTAATTKRPYKKGMDGHTGILDMIKNSGSSYDPNILKTLVYTLSIFPIGTFVELSTGAKGLVIKTDPDNPKRPYIKMIMNPEGTPYPELPIFQPMQGDDVTIKRPLTTTEKKELEKIFKVE